jgi:hypothetical protein
MLVVGDSGLSLDPNVVEISRGAGENRDRLLDIGAAWSKLVIPERPVEAFKSNLASLSLALSEVKRDSAFRKEMAPAKDRYYLEIDRRRPDATYESQILLNLAKEKAAPSQPIKGNEHVSNPPGRVNAECVFENESISKIRLEVYSGSACQDFYADLELRDQALAAGRIFANKLKEVEKDFEVSSQIRHPIELGSYIFRGQDGPAAAAAFLARNIQNVIMKSETQNELDLPSIVEMVPIRRVRSVTPGQVYDIDADLISYRLQMTGYGEIELSARLNPAQMFRDPNTWFSSSTAAQELASILLVTGIAHVLPQLANHAVEATTKLNFGNGYASLSRMICGMISGSREEDRDKLLKLDGLFDKMLGDELCRFRKMSSSIATHLVLDLLSGLVGNNNIDPSLADFSGRSLTKSPIVNSCNLAEEYFVFSVKSGAYWLDRYFLYKKEGEKTALTRVPIVVDKVLIPKGTLCFVSKRDGVIELVKPLRLTLFNLPLDGEGAEVFRLHLGEIYSAGLTDTDVRAVYQILDDDSCGSPRGS